ncbi:MarR family transcriptional regulator [Corynebacterium epidermidicanis]|nr:helix-turn-helix domain-containing protein [Corynebacterium epidermidicanis]
MQTAFHQIFEKPTTPAAQVLYHIRQSPRIGRGELVTATGLSQPTITRAVIALTTAGLLQERRDLINTTRPGRPVVPLELTTWPGLLIGIAVDVDDCIIGCYDFRGRLLREVHVAEAAPEHPVSDVLEYIMAAIHRIKGEVPMPLRSISLGVASPHWTDLSWIKHRLEFEFSVPAIAANAAASIAIAEVQQNRNQANVFVLFDENSTSAAWITENAIISTSEIRTVDEWLRYIINGPRPSSVLFSGTGFSDPQVRTRIRSLLNTELGTEVQLRVTRPELETLRTISAALAMSPLQADPLKLAREASRASNRAAKSSVASEKSSR